MPSLCKSRFETYPYRNINDLWVLFFKNYLITHFFVRDSYHPEDSGHITED